MKKEGTEFFGHWPLEHMAPLTADEKAALAADMLEEEDTRVIDGVAVAIRRLDPVLHNNDDWIGRRRATATLGAICDVIDDCRQIVYTLTRAYCSESDPRVLDSLKGALSACGVCLADG